MEISLRMIIFYFNKTQILKILLTFMVFKINIFVIELEARNEIFGILIKKLDISKACLKDINFEQDFLKIINDIRSGLN